MPIPNLRVPRVGGADREEGVGYFEFAFPESGDSFLRCCFNRHEAHDGFLPAGDNNFFTAFGLLDKPGRDWFGLVNGRDRPY